ncbi:Uncharacterized protein APZ42_017096 [Daphnia magna]|uniref:Uncharacterized protein n=1 Tax=Daphnia magna TaxID=35525 RepID=A0A0N8DLT7_9CRUS|nr:Uncharacterized protein APZ42_017096 [Daphnia magna]
MICTMISLYYLSHVSYPIALWSLVGIELGQEYYPENEHRDYHDGVTEPFLNSLKPLKRSSLCHRSKL